MNRRIPKEALGLHLVELFTPFFASSLEGHTKHVGDYFGLFSFQGFLVNIPIQHSVHFWFQENRAFNQTSSGLNKKYSFRTNSESYLIGLQTKNKQKPMGLWALRVCGPDLGQHVADPGPGWKGRARGWGEWWTVRSNNKADIKYLSQ